MRNLPDRHRRRVKFSSVVLQNIIKYYRVIFVCFATSNVNQSTILINEIYVSFSKCCSFDRVLILTILTVPAVRDLGADAGADVEA